MVQGGMEEERNLNEGKGRGWGGRKVNEGGWGGRKEGGVAARKEA